VSEMNLETGNQFYHLLLFVMYLAVDFFSVTGSLNVRSGLIGGVWNCSLWEVKLFGGCWKKY